MKRLLLILLVFSAFGLNAQSITTLEGLARPRMIAVDDSQLYVSDEYTIYIYSLKDGTLVKQFGQEGEGPGDFRFRPWIDVLEDSLMISDSKKVCYYSKSGEPIREKRLPAFLSFLAKIKGKFAAQKWDFDRKTKASTVSIWLFDDQLKPIKRLYAPPKLPESNRKGPPNLVFPKMKFLCGKDRIYLTPREPGFRIEVFDADGEPVATIKREYQPVKVTEVHKQRLIKEYAALIPVVRKRLARGENLKFAFPQYFHAINSIHFADGILYVKTFALKDGKEEYLLHDSDGNYLRTIYLPAAGRDHFAFKNNRLYYIDENMDEEEWELHVVNIDAPDKK